MSGRGVAAVLPQCALYLHRFDSPDNGFYSHFWVDLSLILLCALTGLVLGFVSLYLMQSVVEQVLGRAASWLFIAAVAA